MNEAKPDYLSDEQWQEILDAEARRLGGEPDDPQPTSGGRRSPIVVIKLGEIERVVNETETALIAAQDAAAVAHRLFRRGNRIVAIGFWEEPTHDGGTTETQIIAMVEDYTLIERMASSIVFMKYDGRKKGALVRCDPPMGVAAPCANEATA